MPLKYRKINIVQKRFQLFFSCKYSILLYIFHDLMKLGIKIIFFVRVGVELDDR